MSGVIAAIPSVFPAAISGAQDRRPVDSARSNENTDSNTGKSEAQDVNQRLLQANEGDNTNAEGLTPEEVKAVQELKRTDAKVRAHEQAHKSVGGPYTGAIQYQTVTGPDGREYAVAGEVSIDVSPVRDDPEATIRKMDIVIRAALAPAEPSPQDFAVARTAQQIRLQARLELQQQEPGDTQSNPFDIAQEQVENQEQAIENNENIANDKSERTRQDPIEAALSYRNAARLGG